jgi:hypothetical protein
MFSNSLFGRSTIFRYIEDNDAEQQQAIDWQNLLIPRLPSHGTQTCLLPSTRTPTALSEMDVRQKVNPTSLPPFPLSLTPQSRSHILLDRAC